MSRPYVRWKKHKLIRSGWVDGYVSHKGQVCACVRCDDGRQPAWTHVPLAKILEDDEVGRRVFPFTLATIDSDGKIQELLG